MKTSVKEKLNGVDAHHALDAISSNGTWVPTSQMLSRSSDKETSYLSVVSGTNKYKDEGIQKNVDVVYTYSGTVHSGAYRPGMPKRGDVEQVKSDPEFRFLLFRYVAKMLADGRFHGHPFEAVDGGLNGVEEKLTKLKEGKARGVKFVFGIAEA